MNIGRPAKAATATVKIAPDSQPAGMPSMPKVTPPIAANASVSATWRVRTMRLGAGADKMGGFDNDSCKEPRQRGP